MELPIIKTDQKSLVPYMVETMPTENWHCHSPWKTLGCAMEAAKLIRHEYPNLKLRIVHRTGGKP